MKGIVQIVLFILIWALAIVFTVFLILPVLAVHLFLLFAGAEARAATALERFDSVLMRDEVVIEKDIQSRVFALWKRRAVVAITSSRMIVVQRGWFGGFRMTDIQWKDLQDARLEQNVLAHICGSNIEFKHLNPGHPTMVVNGVPERTAAAFYSYAQSEEQAWEEKRRVRHMEEVRAASGGITLGGGFSNSPHPPEKVDNTLDELEKAKRLLDLGAISDAEYNEMKAKILGRI